MSATILIKKSGDSIPFDVNDRIFLGEGLFETLRVSKGRPCYAELHWQRIHQSAINLGLSLSLTFSDWQTNLDQCIKVCSLQEGGLKVLFHTGSGQRGLNQEGLHPRLIFTGFSYQRTRTAAKLVTAPWERDADNPVYQFKSINYFEAILAHKYAANCAADDVLFFNTRHEAAETSIANFFLIHNNKLLTPAIHSGILAGITRERILHYCKENAIPYAEQAISRELIETSEAAFICNALQGIRRISGLDQYLFSDDHPLIQQLEQAL